MILVVLTSVDMTYLLDKSKLSCISEVWPILSIRDDARALLVLITGFVDPNSLNQALQQEIPNPLLLRFT